MPRARGPDGARPATSGTTGTARFEWTEGNPISKMARFLLSGEGEVAPVTREVLREVEPEPRRRPTVHVS